MSVNADVESVVTPLPVPLEEPLPAPAETVQKSVTRRPAWMVPVALAIVALVPIGGLGYFLYATAQQRDLARHQLAATQTTLSAANADLATAKTDAASRKVTADYVSLYIVDEGKVQTDYFDIVSCNNFSECRTAAQELLTDAQKFQADRAAANVPTRLTSSDNGLRDALSALIAGDQEFISGMDNNDDNKAKDGGKKVDGAMLSMAKAEARLGTELR